MNTMPDRSSGIAYDKSRPLILVASSPEAAERARVAIDQHGLRIGAVVGVDDAGNRLAEQAVTGSVWVEVDEDAGGKLEGLLYQLRYDSAERGYGAVVSTNKALVDRVTSCLGNSNVLVLADADERERRSALRHAMKRSRKPERISDISSDRDETQLRQLAKEINHIAEKLAQLTVEDPILPQGEEFPPERIRRVIRARRSRSRYFKEGLFADPAWDMLLDLFHAEQTHLKVPVSSLCIAAGVPATTALRWLKTMVAEGLVNRQSDPRDGRRIFVGLTPQASSAIRQYFSEIGDVPGV